MPIVRRIARPLLSSIFIYGGVEAFRNADAKVPAAEKVVAKLPPKLPMIGTTKQLVQADAAAKVIAGSMLALGRFPRLSALGLAVSLVPTTLAGHRFWEETDPVKRKAQQVQLAKNASVLGGVLLAAVDTHGKPSVGWRARRTARQLRRGASDAAASIGGHASALGGHASALGGHASSLSGHASTLGDRASALGDRASALGEKASSTLSDRASALGEKVHDLRPA